MYICIQLYVNGTDHSWYGLNAASGTKHVLITEVYSRLGGMFAIQEHVRIPKACCSYSMTRSQVSDVRHLENMFAFQKPARIPETCLQSRIMFVVRMQVRSNINRK